MNSKNKDLQIPLIKAEDAIKDTEYLEHILSVMGDKFEEEFEHAQGRSNFQIEKFIAMNDFTISAVYKHVLKNSAIMRKELFRVIKEGIEKQREFEYKWKDKPKDQPIKWFTEEGGKKLCWYDTDCFENKVKMRELAISIKDKVQQLAFFDQILEELEKKNGGAITKEQFDREEPTYWKRRFSKQIHDEIIHKQTGVGVGNIESARRASLPPILPDSKNQIDSLPSLDILLEDPGKWVEQANNIMVESFNELGRKQIAPKETKNEELLEEHPSEQTEDSTFSNLGIEQIKKEID